MRLMKKRERIQVPNSWDEEGLSVTDPSKIKRIARKYCEHLFLVNMLKNLDKMDRFLGKYNLSKITKEKNLNSPITCIKDQIYY